VLAKQIQEEGGILMTTNTDIPTWLEREMNLAEEDKLQELLSAAGQVWDAWHIRVINLPNAIMGLHLAMLAMGHDVAHYTGPSPYLDILQEEQYFRVLAQRQKERDEWVMRQVRMYRPKGFWAKLKWLVGVVNDV